MRSKKSRAIVAGIAFLIGFYIALGLPGAPPWEFGWILYLYPVGGLIIAMLGGGVFVEAMLALRKERKMHWSGRRDPWDLKDEPVEYGTWKPNDDNLRGR